MECIKFSIPDLIVMSWIQESFALSIGSDLISDLIVMSWIQESNDHYSFDSSFH